VIAPGKRADIALLSDFADCRVAQVICGGIQATDEAFAKRTIVPPVGLDSVHVGQVTASKFDIPARNSEADVIGVVPGRIITEHLKRTLPVTGGKTLADLDQDVLKVAVVERHKGTGNIGLGFVNGFGMKQGAIASSVGHDSHNICVVGADEEAMAHAVNRVIAMKGGFAVADKGGVKAELALPLAGLMSLEPFETVKEELEHLRAAAKDLGCTLAEPFLQVAFLPLPVIPHLKITDFGVFDVNKFELIDQGS
jgi:adenine deaminase